MSAHEINLLCTGDLHLGRHPSKIPQDYDSREYSPALIWQEIVQKAVEIKADALVISGDIVDRDNRLFEAFGPFEAGIKRLEEFKIPVYTVAGNHDFDVLPGLARNIDSDFFFFLGEGGRWEEARLRIDGREVLNFIGWSYPHRHVRRNPLDSFKLPANSLPTVGLLHTEVDNPGSNYAPVTSGELQENRLTGWVVGHIHKPGLLIENPFILNPGSPQPLNPTETGTHGAWQVIINPETGCQINRLPLANLQYLKSGVDISELERVEDLPARISRQLEEELARGEIFDWSPELILARIDLQGYTGFHREIEQVTDQLVQELEIEIAGSRVLIEKIENLARPRLDLERLAGGNSPAALLAGYLIELERGDGDLPETLLRQITSRLTEAYNSNAYQPLRAEGRIKPPGREEALAILRKQARLLLDTLAAQKEGLR